MYNIEFYENSTGTSELWNFMEELRQKAESTSDAHILFSSQFGIELISDTRQYPGIKVFFFATYVSCAGINNIASALTAFLAVNAISTWALVIGLKLPGISKILFMIHSPINASL